MLEFHRTGYPKKIIKILSLDLWHFFPINLIKIYKIVLFYFAYNL